MQIKRILLAVAVVVLLARCFKSVSHQTTYALRTYVQERSGESPQMLDAAVLHAFAADTALWTVDSYEDALAGVITSKAGAETMQPLATAEKDQREGFEGWLSMSIDVPQAMVVVVDTQHKLYGYTQQLLPSNLPELSVEVVFKPWKTGNVYREGNWWMFNDDWVEPLLLDCSVTPMLQVDEQTEPAISTAQIKVYAFSVDTLDWRIASWLDAEAGIITSKENASEQITSPEFRGYGTDGVFLMQVASPLLMVVVVDLSNQMYAYSKQTVDLMGEPVTFPAPVFRLWHEEPLYQEAGWYVVTPPDDELQTAR